MKHEWSARVRAESYDPLAVSARNHSLQVGEPVSFAPKDESISALELAVSALGADLVGSLRKICKLRRIDFERAELSLRWTLDNALTAVGVVGEEGTPAISEIEAVLYVSSLDEQALRDAWEVALMRSPLYSTFSKSIAISLRLNVTS